MLFVDDISMQPLQFSSSQSIIDLAICCKRYLFNYQQNNFSGKMTYNYAKPLKVGLLEDLLNVTKDSDLLMYIEVGAIDSCLFLSLLLDALVSIPITFIYHLVTFCRKLAATTSR